MYIEDRKKSGMSSHFLNNFNEDATNSFCSFHSKTIHAAMPRALLPQTRMAILEFWSLVDGLVTSMAHFNAACNVLEDVPLEHSQCWVTFLFLIIQRPQGNTEPLLCLFSARKKLGCSDVYWKSFCCLG